MLSRLDTFQTPAGRGGTSRRMVRAGFRAGCWRLWVSRAFSGMVLSLAVGWFSATAAVAGSAGSVTGLAGGLDYLFALSAPQASEPVAPARVTKLLDFVLAERQAEEVTEVLGREKLQPLAYQSLTINRTLDDILGYAYHQGIPPYLFSLASVRCSYWKQVDWPGGTLPSIRVEDFHSAAPFLLRGIEYEEIAPDDSSGAYYSYDLKRTLIGFIYRGMPVWISLSRQMHVSDVGRKGFALGNTDTWDFIYSDQPGLTLPGMGWVQSYMYDSFSCAVYIQTAAAPARVKVALFKWLRAGWQGMNFVRNTHIQQGLVRYATNFKNILESKALPPVEEMAAAVAAIDRMPLTGLQSLNRAYLDDLAARYGESADFPQSWFEDQVVNGDFVESLTPTHLKAVAFLEYMKDALGRTRSTLAHMRSGAKR